MQDPSRVRASGPLEVFASGFAAELARLGYRPTPIVFQLQLMAHASRWLERERLGADELGSDIVERFLAERRAAGYTNSDHQLASAPVDVLELQRGDLAGAQPQPREHHQHRVIAAPGRSAALA